MSKRVEEFLAIETIYILENYNIDLRKYFFIHRNIEVEISQFEFMTTKILVQRFLY